MAPLINLVLDYGKTDYWFLLMTIFLILTSYKDILNFKISLSAEMTLIKRLCMDIIEKKDKNKIEENIAAYKNNIAEIYQISPDCLSKENYEYIRMAVIVCSQNVSNITPQELEPYLYGKRKEEKQHDKKKKAGDQNWKYRFAINSFVIIILLITIIVSNYFLGYGCPFEGMDCSQQIELIGMYIIFSIVVSLFWSFIYILYVDYKKSLYSDCLNKIELK